MRPINQRGYIFFEKKVAHIEKYVDRVLETFKFVRGRNRRIFQLYEKAIDLIRHTTPSSIINAFTYEIEYYPDRKHKVIENVILKINEFSPVASYAKYVEFGTGAAGAGQLWTGKYIDVEDEWGRKSKEQQLTDYATHPEAAEAGWEYKPDSEAWVYLSEDGKFRTTYGQTPNAFMYRMYLFIKDMIAQDVHTPTNLIFKKNKPLATNKKWYIVYFDVDFQGNPFITVSKNV